jgi:hypothetical protein
LNGGWEGSYYIYAPVIEGFYRYYGVEVIVFLNRSMVLAIVAGAAVLFYVLTHSLPGVSQSHLLEDGVGIKISISRVIMKGGKELFQVVMRYDLLTLIVRKRSKMTSFSKGKRGF